MASRPDRKPTGKKRPTSPTSPSAPIETPDEMATPGRYCGAPKRADEVKGEPCRNPAGFKTDHPGLGRCFLHGGRNQSTHGRYSTIVRAKLRDAIQRHRVAEDQLDLADELATARALFERYLDMLGDEPATDSLAEAIGLVDDISKIVERIERIRAANAITLPELERLMFQMGQVVKHHIGRHVKDEQAIASIHEKIEEGWLALRS